MLFLASPEDGHHDEDRDTPGEVSLDGLVVDLRAHLLRTASSEPSSGDWLEVLHLVGARVVEHTLVPPSGSARIAGVIVESVGPLRATVGSRLVVEGETVTLGVGDVHGGGELVVRFVPAPRRLLPAETSRAALVVLLVVTCLASLAPSGGSRAGAPGVPARSPLATQVDRLSARAPRAASTRRRSVASRRARHIAQARIGTVRRMASPVRAPRAVRARRVLHRRTAPASGSDGDGGGDGSDPDPDPRARGPPRRRRALLRSVSHPLEVPMFENKSDSPLPVTLPEPSDTVPLAPDPRPAPILVAAWGGDTLDLDENEDDDATWSLASVLTRGGAPTAGAALEVVHARGERVLGHAILDADDTYDVDGASLVTRLSRGGCELVLPPGSRARVRRTGDVSDLDAGARALRVVLAPGDAAHVVVDGASVVVRFVARPRLSLSSADAALANAERKVQAACASAGVALCSLWGAVAWLLDHRLDELTLQLPDDDIQQWTEVELQMPEPAPPPKKEVEPPPPAPDVPAAKATAPARASSKQPAKSPVKATQPSAMEVLKGIPELKSNRALDAALTAVRAPLPARPGGMITSPMSPRGLDVGSIGGGGLDTSGGVGALKRGAASLSGGPPSREIGGRVSRGSLRDLKSGGDVANGLSKEQILAVINEKIGQIQYCYEKGLRANPKLGGRVTVEWMIGPDGSVRRARLATSTLGDNAVERCMLDKIQGWRFPKAASPSTVVFPFSFSSL